MRILDWIRVYAEKLVYAPKSHKIIYAPMHAIFFVIEQGALEQATVLVLRLWIESPCTEGY